MAGDLNANLAKKEGTPRGEAITDELEAARQEDTGINFLPHRKPWFQDRCTCSMRRDGIEVWSWMDYILGAYCRLFQDVAVRDPRHNSDHYMVLGCLSEDPEKELMEYLLKACHFPFQTIHCNLASMPDKLFSDLNTQIPKIPLRERVSLAYIYDVTWAAMDTRVTALYEGAQRTIRKLTR